MSTVPSLSLLQGSNRALVVDLLGLFRGQEREAVSSIHAFCFLRKGRTIWEETCALLQDLWECEDLENERWRRGVLKCGGSGEFGPAAAPGSLSVRVALDIQLFQCTGRAGSARRGSCGQGLTSDWGGGPLSLMGTLRAVTVTYTPNPYTPAGFLPWGFRHHLLIKLI